MTKNYFSTNLMSLRELYGESQLDLSIFLDCNSPSTVSNWEKGTRFPKGYMELSKIAKHYNVTLQDLVENDLRLPIDLYDVTVSNTISLIGTLLPIISTETAKNNQKFVEGLELQQSFRKQLRNVLEGDNSFDLLKMSETLNHMVSAYLEAYKKYHIREAGVNLIGYLSIRECIQKYGCAMPDIEIETLLSSSILENSRYIRNRHDNSLLSDTCEEATYSKTSSFTACMMKNVRKKTCLTDIIDYYMALRYILGIENTSLDIAENRAIGLEMLSMQVNYDNRYSLSVVEALNNLLNSK